MSGRLFSVVLPVHNQAGHVERVVQDYIATLDRLELVFELILVVNGCRDRSLEVCRRLASCDRRVKVVHSVPGGWGLAVRLGLESAEGATLCFTNSARTSGRNLGTVLSRAEREPRKAFKGDRRNRDSFVRSFGSFLYNLECGFVLGTQSRDVNGTPKVFPRLFGKLLTLQSDDDMIDAEFVAVCARESYPLVEVPISSSGRRGGQSTTRLRSALRMYRGVWGLSRRLGGTGWRAAKTRT